MVKMLHLGLLALSAALCEATKLIIKPDNAKSFTDVSITPRRSGKLG